MNKYNLLSLVCKEKDMSVRNIRLFRRQNPKDLKKFSTLRTSYKNESRFVGSEDMEDVDVFSTNLSETLLRGMLRLP